MVIVLEHLDRAKRKPLEWKIVESKISDSGENGLSFY